MTSRPSHLAALLLLAVLGLTACSGAGEDADSAAGEPAAAPADQDVADDGIAADTNEAGGQADTPQRTALAVDGQAESPASVAALQKQAIIQVGTITVQSNDVAAARFALDKVVDAHGGTIADEKTTAAADGKVRMSRVVLRIPVADFDQAMADVGKLGKVTSSTRKAEDVTGQIIDTQARIRAQEQSLRRVEVLFAQAENIRDIVAIEAQLSRRQAELDSLKGQLAYLEDQAAMSTLTVYLEPTPEERTPPAEEDDDIAFVAGLEDGWHALGTVGAGLATVSGALLPFLVVGVVVGVPGAVVARRWLTRHPVRRPAPEA
jgi:hypothetical protein